jgi:hypothetical protein
MSEFDQNVPPLTNEFLDTMRAADSRIIGAMAAAATQARLDHQQMKNAVYWLMNNGKEPGADPDRKKRFEQETADLAGKLEIQGDPVQIFEVVNRYADRTPTGRLRRG